jgi:subtilisin family serine protease
MPRLGWPAALLVLACAPSSSTQPPATPAAEAERASVPPVEPAPPPEEAVEPLAPPEVAYAHGWMPVASTGADAFVDEHPTYDGRGVLIAILDTGVDPAVPGLVTCSTGEPKIVDVRDFSGESRIGLVRVVPRGDTIVVAGRKLAGFGRVLALNTQGPYYAGALAEPALGAPPASDVNGDGDAADVLPLVVVKATDGWMLLADTDGDGSLSGERPVRDYLFGRETFGWASRGRKPPATLAANLGEHRGEPALDLILGLDPHGTHVAGIAAGHDLYGVSGFDGVAPGAQLLALKISDRANGSVSGHGSIVAAMRYAIGVAATRRQPLVINLSFGVGNEREGEARIDRLIDSVLAENPELPVVVSAGNDGPGLSTIGIPASAARAITVGGTVPASFLPPADASAAEIVADFSARGGEVAKPDLVAPGVAYSTVPRFDIGEEVKQGTSMAAPHVSGLVALLLSAMAQEKRKVDARSIRQALMVTARPARRSGFLDEGRGLPDVGAAYRWLARGGVAPAIEVRVAGTATPAAWLVARQADRKNGTVTFELTRPADAPRAVYRLKSDVGWLTPPRRVTLAGERATVAVRYAGDTLPAPGAYTGVVSAWPADTVAGPAFRLVTTLMIPAPSADTALTLRRDTPVASGQVIRSFFSADSARPFQVRMSSIAGQKGLAYLHEPGGGPFREVGGRPMSSGQQAALYRVDARDVVPGEYEASVVAFGGRLAATVTVLHAPVTLTSRVEGGLAVAELGNVGELEVVLGTELRLRGGQREDTVSARGSGIRAVSFEIPAWATGLEVDVRMDRAQWGRFTDFGVTVLDSAGGQLAQSPLQYSFGRLSTLLPEGHRGTRATLSLYPGFADAGDEREWSMVATIRLYADSAIAVAPAEGTGELRLPPGARGAVRFRLPPSPWPLPERFSPLAVVLARHGGQVWTRESAFSRSGP